MALLAGLAIVVGVAIVILLVIWVALRLIRWAKRNPADAAGMGIGLVVQPSLPSWSDFAEGEERFSAPLSLLERFRIWLGDTVDALSSGSTSVENELVSQGEQGESAGHVAGSHGGNLHID